MNIRTDQRLKLLFLSGLTLLTSLLFAQTVYKFSGTAGGPSGNTYTTSNQTVTFYKNGTATSGYTATFKLSNQQFTNAEGLGSIAGAVGFGGTISSAPTNNAIGNFNRYTTLGSIGSPLATDFTASGSSASGSGISTADGAISLFLISDALINSSRTNLQPIGSSVYFADLTIEFNKPVSNPIIHFGGLGGQSVLDYDTRTTSSNNNMSVAGYTADYRLQTTGVTLVRKSGSDNFSVSGARIYDDATWLGVSRNGTCSAGTPRLGAAGSVLVEGNGITSLTFKVYLTGDAGINVNFPTGQSSTYSNGNCSPSFSNIISNTGTVYPSWSHQEIVSGDGTSMAISFNTVDVTGTVFNDKDAGNVDNGAGGATQASGSIPDGIYINLVDASGKVVESVPVATDGSYTLTAAQSGIGYTAQLSIGQLAEGASAPTTFTPPNGWENTGSFVGAAGGGNSGNLNGTSTSFTPNENGMESVNFGIRDPSALSAKFGYLKAKFINGKLVVDFQTLSETNTSHFEIEASKDGKNFTKIGALNSNSGDSNTPQQYQFTLNAQNALGLLGVSLAIIGLFGFGYKPGRKKLAFMTMLIIIGVTTVIISCSKEGGKDVNANENVFVRVVEVDKNNNKEFSQPVKVVRD